MTQNPTNEPSGGAPTPEQLRKAAVQRNLQAEIAAIQELPNSPEFTSLPVLERERRVNQIFDARVRPLVTSIEPNISLGRIEELRSRALNYALNALPQNVQTQAPQQLAAQQAPQIARTNPFESGAQPAPESLQQVGAMQDINEVQRLEQTQQTQRQNLAREQFNQTIQSNPDLQNQIEDKRQRLLEYFDGSSPERARGLAINIRNASPFEVMQQWQAHINRNEAPAQPNTPPLTRTENILASLSQPANIITTQGEFNKIASQNLPMGMGNVYQNVADATNTPMVEAAGIDADEFLNRYLGMNANNPVSLTRINRGTQLAAIQSAAGFGGRPDVSNLPSQTMTREELKDQMVSDMAMDSRFTDRLIQNGRVLSFAELRATDPNLANVVAEQWVRNNLDRNVVLTNRGLPQSLAMTYDQRVQAIAQQGLGAPAPQGVFVATPQQAAQQALGIQGERGYQRFLTEMQAASQGRPELLNDANRAASALYTGFYDTLASAAQGMIALGREATNLAADVTINPIANLLGLDNAVVEFTNNPYNGPISQSLQDARNALQGMNEVQIAATGGAAQSGILTSDVPYALGNLAATISAGLLGGGAGAVAVGAGQNVASQYNSIIEQGGTPEQALKSAWAASGIGAVDAMIAFKFIDGLKRFPGVATFLQNRLSPSYLTNAFANGVEEGTMEVMQSALNTLTTNEILDVSNDLITTDALKEGGIGFVLGALIGSMEGRTRNAQTSEEDAQVLQQATESIRQAAKDRNVLIGEGTRANMRNAIRTQLEAASPETPITDAQVDDELNRVVNSAILSQVIGETQQQQSINAQQIAQDVELRQRVKEIGNLHNAANNMLNAYVANVNVERERTVAESLGLDIPTLRQNLAPDGNINTYETMLAAAYMNLQPKKYEQQVSAFNGFANESLKYYNELQTLLGRPVVGVQPETQVSEQVAADVTQSIDANSQTQQSPDELVAPIQQEAGTEIQSNDPEVVASALRRSPAFSAIQGSASDTNSPMGNLVQQITKLPATERIDYVRNVIAETQGQATEPIDTGVEASSPTEEPAVPTETTPQPIAIQEGVLNYKGQEYANVGFLFNEDGDAIAVQASTPQGIQIVTTTPDEVVQIQKLESEDNLNREIAATNATPEQVQAAINAAFADEIEASDMIDAIDSVEDDTDMVGIIKAIADQIQLSGEAINPELAEELRTEYQKLTPEQQNELSQSIVGTATAEAIGIAPSPTGEAVRERSQPDSKRRKQPRDTGRERRTTRNKRGSEANVPTGGEAEAEAEKLVSVDTPAGPIPELAFSPVQTEAELQTTEAKITDAVAGISDLVLPEKPARGGINTEQKTQFVSATNQVLGLLDGDEFLNQAEAILTALKDKTSNSKKDYDLALSKLLALAVDAVGIDAVTELVYAQEVNVSLLPTDLEEYGIELTARTENGNAIAVLEPSEGGVAMEGEEALADITDTIQSLRDAANKGVTVGGYAGKLPTATNLLTDIAAQLEVIKNQNFSQEQHAEVSEITDETLGISTSRSGEVSFKADAPIYDRLADTAEKRPDAFVPDTDQLTDLLNVKTVKDGDKRITAIRERVANKFTDWLVNKGVAEDVSKQVVAKALGGTSNKFGSSLPETAGLKRLRRTVSDFTKQLNTALSLFSEGNAVNQQQASEAMYALINNPDYGQLFLENIKSAIANNNDARTRLGDAVFAQLEASGIPYNDSVAILDGLGLKRPSNKVLASKEKKSKADSFEVPATNVVEQVDTRKKKPKGKGFVEVKVTKRFDPKQPPITVKGRFQTGDVTPTEILIYDTTLADYRKVREGDLTAEQEAEFLTEFINRVENFGGIEMLYSTKPGESSQIQSRRTILGLPAYKQRPPAIDATVYNPRQLAGLLVDGWNQVLNSKTAQAYFKKAKQSARKLKVYENVSGATFLGAFSPQQTVAYIARKATRNIQQPIVLAHEFAHYVESILNQFGAPIDVANPAIATDLLKYAGMEYSSDPSSFEEGFANYYVSRLRNPDYVSNETPALHNEVNRAIKEALGEELGGELIRLTDDIVGRGLQEYFSATRTQQIDNNLQVVSGQTVPKALKDAVASVYNTMGNSVRGTFEKTGSAFGLGPALKNPYNASMRVALARKMSRHAYDGHATIEAIFNYNKRQYNAVIKKGKFDIPKVNSEIEIATIAVRGANAAMGSLQTGFTLDANGVPMIDPLTGQPLNTNYLYEATAGSSVEVQERVLSAATRIGKTESTEDYFMNFAVQGAIDASIKAIDESEELVATRRYRFPNDSIDVVVEKLKSDGGIFQRMSEPALREIITEAIQLQPEQWGSITKSMLRDIENVKPSMLMDFTGSRPSVSSAALRNYNFHPSIAEAVRKGFDPYSKESFAYDGDGTPIALTGLIYQDGNQTDYLVWAEQTQEYLRLNTSANNYLSQNPSITQVSTKRGTFRVVLNSRMDFVGVVDSKGNEVKNPNILKNVVEKYHKNLMAEAAKPRAEGNVQASRQDFLEYIAAKEFLRRYREFANQHFKYMYDTGIISQEQYAESRKKNPAYIAMHRVKAERMTGVDVYNSDLAFDPFSLFDSTDFFYQRDMELANITMSGKGTVERQEAAIAAAKTGGQRATTDIVGNLMAMIDMGRKMVVRNNYLKVLYEMDTAAREIDRLSGVQVPDASFFFNELPSNLTPTKGEPVMSIFFDGERKRVVVRSNEMLDAMGNLIYGLQQSAMGGWAKRLDVGSFKLGTMLHRALKALGNITKFSITTLPTNAVKFVTWDFFRSFMARMASSQYDYLPGMGSNKGIRVMAKALGALPMLNPYFWIDTVVGMYEGIFNEGILNESDVVKRYKALGGEQISDYYANPENFQKMQRESMAKARGDVYMDLDSITDLSKVLVKVKTVGPQAWAGYNRTLKGFDYAVRIAEFNATTRKLKELGVDELTAEMAGVKNARGLMDFSVASNSGRALNTYIPFFNAALQSQYKVLKAVNSPSVMFRMVAQGMLLHTLYYAMLSDEEEEEVRAFPQEVRDGFWMFKIGPDNWLRIPKPYDLGLFMKIGGNLYDEFIQQNMDVDWGVFGRRALEENTPLTFAMSGGKFSFGGLMKLLPPTAKAAIEVTMNRDAFYNQDIVQDWRGPEVDYTIGAGIGLYDDVSLGAQLMGQLMEQDPRYIDFMAGRIAPNLTVVADDLYRIITDEERRQQTEAMGTGAEVLRAFKFTVGSPVQSNRWTVSINEMAEDVGGRNVRSDNPKVNQLMGFIRGEAQRHKDLLSNTRTQLRRENITQEERDSESAVFIMQAEQKHAVIKAAYDELMQILNND